MTTNNRLLTTLLLLLTTLTLAAGTISEDAARQLAAQFLNQSAGPHRAPTTAQQLTLAARTDGAWLFNRAQGAGYVVVSSADNAAQPILGYADTGTIDADNMPCNLRWWLAQYADEAAWAASHATVANNAATVAGNAATAGPQRAATVTRAAIAPLVETNWSQSAPYNNLCPEQNGTRTYTGCVATAVAQIMRYHKHPEQGKGTVSYTWDSQTLTRDLSESTYDWDNMITSYEGTYTTDQANAVARLMVDVGYSVSMGYSTSGSGASSRAVPAALINNFGYSSQTSYKLRSNYGLTDWTDLLYQELASGRPVYYAGYNSSGHAFVIDGYRQGYFHVNWGWGGMSDGYFLISALDPDQQGIGGSSSGYNSGQEAIIGIEPATGDTPTVTVEPSISLDSFTAYQDTIARNSGYSFYTMGGWIRNNGNTDVTGYMGLKVVGEDGSQTILQSYGSHDFSAGMGSLSSVLYVRLNQFPTDQTQTYKVYPVFRLKDADTWYDVTVSSGSQYLLATTDAKNVYFSTPASPVVTLSATGISVPEKVFAGKTFNLKATISATGGEYNGRVRVYNGSDLLGYATVNVDDRTQATIAVECTAPSATGTYQLTLQDASGNTLASSITLTVSEAPSGAFAVTVPSHTVISGKPSDFRVKATFKCTSGFYDGPLTVFVFPGSWGTSIGSATANVTIGEGEEQTISFSGSYAEQSGSTSYNLGFYYVKDNTYTRISYGSFTSTTTASTFDNIADLISAAYSAATTVSATERPSLTGTTVTFGSDNPATVVAVTSHQDSDDAGVAAGSVFITDTSERGLLLSGTALDLTTLHVGDQLTGTLAGNYSETSVGLPTFTLLTATGTSIDRSGEATSSDDADVTVFSLPSVAFIAKTNTTAKDGTANVGNIAQQAYGPYLATLVELSGTLAEAGGRYYLLDNEDDDAATATLARIAVTADQVSGLSLADYVGTSGTLRALLVKQSVTEAKLTALDADFMTVSKLYLSENDDEQRLTRLCNNGALSADVDLYMHRTNLVSAADGVATICLPFDLTASDFQQAFGCTIDMLAQATDKVTGGVQQFESLSDKTIRAGVPYLLKASGTQTRGNATSKANTDYWTSLGTRTITAAQPQTVTASSMDGQVGGAFHFCGLYGKKQYTTGTDGQPTTTLIADGGSQKYQYISTQDGTLRYLPAASTLAFSGLRAYYYFPSWDSSQSGSGNQNAKVSIAIDGQTVTAIDGISLDNAPAPRYNLQGQRINPSAMPKGVYVEKGRKMIKLIINN